jgi:predicted  nucleic acid-binding Zn-ribbon protein
MERIQGTLEDKEDKIADLTDQLENLMEENKTLKDDINDLEAKELANRRKILEVFPVIFSCVFLIAVAGKTGQR